MARCVFLGLTTVDILNYVNRYPRSNEKLQADYQLIFAGGPAANAAVACAAMGSEVRLITGLGDTVVASLAKDDLYRHRVEIIDEIDNSQLLPVLSSITVDESCGDRSVVYTNTAMRRLKCDALFENILTDTSVVMLDGYYLEQARMLALMAKRMNITVVIDGGSWKEGLENVLPLVDYAICSENFMPPGCTDSGSVMKYLLHLGVRNIAVSRGGQSVVAWECGTQVEIPVQAVQVRDTLGAGDILHGVFCHNIGHADFVTSLRGAIEMASTSCRYRGAREWITFL